MPLREHLPLLRMIVVAAPLLRLHRIIGVESGRMGVVEEEAGGLLGWHTQAEGVVEDFVRQ